MSIRFLIGLLLLAQTAFGADEGSTVSAEFKEFLKGAEYVVMGEKQGMKLIAIECFKGNKKVGELLAEYSNDPPPPYTITPEESWRDLIIWSPARKVLSYYRIQDGQFEWFEAKDRKNRFVKLADLREYLKE